MDHNSAIIPCESDHNSSIQPCTNVEKSIFNPFHNDHSATDNSHNAMITQPISKPTKKKAVKEPWKVMYANARGMKSKQTSLIEIAQDCNPQLFLLTETQTRSNVPIQIPGYVFHGRKREGMNGGGVEILVRDDLRSNTSVHKSQRRLEIMWVSIRRKNLPPLFFGTYYGRQETRTSKEEIEAEMMRLSEEIKEIRNEGDFLLTMDANAKIGILGEEISRNGKYLLKTIEENNLTIMNKSSKCKGKITRMNTQKETEFSAIDFVIATETMERWIKEILIDKDGLHKLKGRNETDHNTIIIGLELTNVEKTKVPKRTTWNMRASEEKWNEYRLELSRRQPRINRHLMNKNQTMNRRYRLIYGEIESAARRTTGKTTIREGSSFRTSKELQHLRKEKRNLKNQIRQETDDGHRKRLILEYKAMEIKVRTKLQLERKEQAKVKLQKIIKDKSKNNLCKEIKRVSRDPSADAMVLKDSNGIRHFTPDGIKECTANYYEDLYKKKPVKYHPYHQQLEQNIIMYKNDRQFEDLRINQPPTIHEITEIINAKKNGKSMTDIKNEMLKRPGVTMIEIIHPLITAIMNDETIIDEFNTGHITSLFKGKGDQEELKNYRGITTSSGIGAIMDSLLDRRIQSIVPFTQAQGGGRRGASTCDHLFIMRAIIDVSIKEKRQTFVTFYDVTKAYDNADNNDMLAILWEKGFKGKAWRLLANLTDRLKAIPKTKYGPARTIEMEIGGRQGSSLTGRLFSKLMDMISEELQESGDGFYLSEEFLIPVLLWVDDVISFAEGEENQELILQKIDDFAVRHKLKWGQSKCNVMRVGHHTSDEKDWKLGELTIHETKSYRYLGDVLTNDGKNAANLESRKNAVQAKTVFVNSIAASDVIQLIESSALMEMHETKIIPALLMNSEAWNLSKGEVTELERIEIQALKHLFDLPVTTPTPAIIFSFGTMYTNQRVHKKQLNFLHKTLKKYDGHWPKRALEILEFKNIGWSRKIKETLAEYELPTDFSVIKTIPRLTWIREVAIRIEQKNNKRLLDDCHKSENNISTPKTKTAFIVNCLNASDYKRGMDINLTQLSRQECKTLIIARYKMLQCGRNFKGTMSEMCNICNVTDDEDHVLNHCPKYEMHRESDTCINFNDIYSNQIEILRAIISTIERFWNTSNAHGTLHRD